jgi:tape measure domain-containing protein
VKGTAFGLGDAATIAASAVAAGVKPGEELTKYLSLTADAATIAGSSLGEMGAILNKVQTSGKAYTDNLNMLADRGIPIFQWLQDEYGVTAEGLSDMVKEGKVDAETFRKVIEENIGGAALESGKTLRGSFANMQAALGRIGAAAITPFMPMMKSSLGALTSWADKVTPIVQERAEALKLGLSDMAAAFKTSGESVTGSASGFERFGMAARVVTDGLQGVWSLLKDGDFLGEKMTFGLSESSGFVKALLRIHEGMTALWEVVRSPDKQKFSEFMETLKSSGDNASSTASKFESGVTTIGGALAKLGGAAAAGGVALAALAGDTGTVAVHVLRQLGGVMGYLADHTGVATAALAGLAASFAIAQTAQTGFHIARVAQVIMTPAEIASRMAMTRAIIAQTAVMKAHIKALGGEAPVQELTRRQRLAAIVTRQRETAAIVAQTSALARWAVAQQAAAASSGALVGAMRNTAAAAAVAGARLQGYGVAAARGIKSVASSAAALAGGPLGISLLAVAGGYFAISNEVDKANRQHELLSGTTDGVVESQKRLRDALRSTAGEMTGDAVSAFEESISQALAVQNELAETGPGILSKAAAGWATLFNNWDGATGFAEAVKQQDQIAKAGENVSRVFADLKVSNADLSAGIRGTNGQFNALASRIDTTTTAGKQASSWLTTERTEYLNLQAAIKNLTPEYLAVAEAFEVLSSESKSAAEQSEVLFNMLQRIAGINPDLKTAVDNQNQVLRDAQEGPKIDESKGAIADLIGGDGRVSTTTENGQALSDQLDDITKAAVDSAVAGRNLDEVFASAGESFGATATQFGRDAEEIRKAAELQGFNENAIRITAFVENADGAVEDLGHIWTSLKYLKPDEPKTVTVDSEIDKGALDQIRSFGAEVEEITAADGTKQYRIDLDSEEARRKLDEFLTRLAAAEAFKAKAGIELDTDSFELSVEESSALMNALSQLQALPGVDLNLSQFEGKSNVTVAALAELSTKTAEPQVLLDITKALADAGIVDAELNRIANAQRTARIDVAVNTYGANSPQAFVAATNGMSEAQFRERFPQYRAEGGPIFGPGGPTSDSIPAMLSAGEHVLTASEVDAAGGQGAIYRMRQMIRAGALRFNEGGAVGNGIEKALRAGRSVTGNKYVWGGTGPTGFDCSGFVGWLQQIVMGVEGSLKRLYTTYDLMGSSNGFAGLLPGLGPAGTQFQVGVNQEHMAATVGGQPAESGGSHGDSRIGPPAVGATDSQFTKWFHLPNSSIAGWDERSSSRYDKDRPEWTESDELDLQDAILAVQDAKDARAKLDKEDSKATDTDRQRADIAIQRAQIRAQEKQAEKDEVAAWAPDAPAPQAPAMAEAWEKEERDRIRAQIAVDEANTKRNEVYADPFSTENDKLNADMELQDAQDALAEILEGEGKSGKGKEKLDYSLRGTMTRFGYGAVDAVMAGIFGQLPEEIASSRWVTTDWGSLIPDEVDGEGSGWLFDKEDPLGRIPAPSKDKVDKQLPVTPGAPGWLDGLLKVDDFAEKLPPDELEKLRKRAPKVYDTGGWLQPGEMAVNLSDRPEPIFNSPDQLRRFAGQLEPAVQSGQTIDMSVNFHGDVATRDDNELIEKIRYQQQRAASLRRRR